MEKTKNYLKYGKEFKKINILSIILYTLMIILVLFMMFGPIFSFVTEKQITLEDFNNDLEAYLKYLSQFPPEQQISGIVSVRQNVSFFDELWLGIKNFSSTESGVGNQILSLLIILGPLITAFYTIVEVILGIKRLVNELYGLKNFDNYALLEYTKIKQDVDGASKAKASREWRKYAIAYCWLLSIFYGRFFVPLFADYASFSVSCESYLAKITGVSAWFLFVAVLFVGYIAISILISKEKKKVTIRIVEDLNNGEETENAA